ncbi:hypothetical protein CEXT_311211 [Caerostris extrusa]|uniref:Uncharacterized protein n=1 Tax=Caerostris extrusa TaxID=172846 RepID=A0AAV4SXB6_CAEEX|nr:hypothetical protein CEXT_311211 [Caerostris extrusa]
MVITHAKKTNREKRREFQSVPGGLFRSGLAPHGDDRRPDSIPGQAVCYRKKHRGKGVEEGRAVLFLKKATSDQAARSSQVTSNVWWKG